MDDKKFSAAIDLLAESWRLAHFTEKFADGADDKLRKKISNQVTRFEKHFHAAAEAFGLEVVDFTGAEFETGLPVAPINLADFTAEEKLFVAAMLEPTIKIAGSAEVKRFFYFDKKFFMYRRGRHVRQLTH